jgi:hypothetical protein
MPKLTTAKAEELGGSLQRIAELSGKSIIESSDAAEKRGLEAFLAREAVEHLPELLGSWFAMQTNYVPLVRGFAALIASANGILGQAAAKAEPAKPADAPQGDSGTK